MTLYKRVILTKPYKSKIYKAKTLKEAINLCYEDLKNNCDDEYFSVLDIDKNEEYTFMTKKKNNNINKKMEQIEKNLDLKYSKNEDLDEIDQYLDSNNSTDSTSTFQNDVLQPTNKNLSCNINIPKNNKEINLIKLSISELKEKINILDNKIGKINKLVEAKELIFEKTQLEKELSLQNKIKKEYSEKLALKEQQIRKEYIEKLEKEQRDKELILKEQKDKEQLLKEQRDKEQKDKEQILKELILKEQRDKERKDREKEDSEQKEKELIQKIQKQMDNKKKLQRKCVNANDMDNWCIFM